MFCVVCHDCQCQYKDNNNNTRLKQGIDKGTDVMSTINQSISTNLSLTKCLKYLNSVNCLKHHSHPQGHYKIILMIVSALFLCPSTENMNNDAASG